MTKRTALAVAYACSLIAYTKLVLPIREQPIWGDDYLLLRSTSFTMGYGSNESLPLLQTSASKYRPVFQVFYSFLHERYDDNLQGYLWVAKALILVLALVLALLLSTVTRLRAFSIPVAIAIVSTMRFLWPATEWILGIMDLLAIIFGLLAVFFYIRSQVKGASYLYLLLGHLSLLLAIFTHEKSMVVAIAASIFMTINRRFCVASVSKLTIVMPIALLLATYILKIIVFNLNPFQGSQLNYDTLDSDMARVYLTNSFQGGISKLFGFSSYQFPDLGLENFQTAMSMILILIITASIYSLMKEKVAAQSSENDFVPPIPYPLVKTGVFFIFLVGLGSFGILLVEPYAQERFLVLPQLSLIIIILHASTFTPKSTWRKVLFTTLTLMVVVGIELSYQSSRNEHNPTQTRIISLMTELRPYYEGELAWELEYYVPDDIERDVPWEYSWAVGYPVEVYSGIFSETINPPSTINSSTSTNVMLCIRASFNADNLKANVVECGQ